MSRARYLTLFSWLGRSPALHRLSVLVPLAMAATTVQAPLVHSSQIAMSADAPSAKKEEPLRWATDPQAIPSEISLLHSGAHDWLAEPPAGLIDPVDFKPLSSRLEFQPPAIPPTSVAIANDPPTAQPLTQPAAAGEDDSGLLSRDFNTPDAGTTGTDFPVDNPVSTPDPGSSGSPSVGTPTPVPEPSSIILLPASVILMRRRKF